MKREKWASRSTFILAAIGSAVGLGDAAAAGNLFFDVSQTTGTTSGFGEIPTAILIALVVAWGCIWYCIRDGAQSVGKVVKFTVGQLLHLYLFADLWL